MRGLCFALALALSGFGSACSQPGDGTSGGFLPDDANPGLDGLVPDGGGDVSIDTDILVPPTDALDADPDGSDAEPSPDTGPDAAPDADGNDTQVTDTTPIDGDGETVDVSETVDDATPDLPPTDATPSDADIAPDGPPPCEPTTCAALDLDCGEADDGCDGTLSCGTCAEGLDCVAGQCTDPCGPAPCEPLWSSTCSGTTGYKVCGLNPQTGCPAQSLFVSCQFGNSCASGACGGACVVPEVMLVVDRSSSMQGPVWDFTRSTLLDVTERWQAQVKLGLRPFPGDAGCEPGQTFGMALDNAAVFETGLIDPAVSSSTPLAAALAGLTPLFGDPTQGEVVILLSDGSETCADVADVADQARVLRSRGTILHTIGLGFGYDGELLTGVALAGGGTFSVAQSGAELTQALETVLAMEVGCLQPSDGVSLCVDGTCELDCDPGFHPCGDDCADDSSVDTCGSSCSQCPIPAHGASTCDGVTCGFTCDDGYHACGNECADDTSPSTCGSSCTPCPSPLNGAPVCDGGTCGFVCDTGYHACGDTCADNDAVASCGSSCTPCPDVAGGQPTCDGETCGYTCDPGFLDCEGACAACPDDPNGSPVCDGAACLTDCDPDYHLCDDVCVSDADVAHCGGACSPCPDVTGGQPTCDGETCGYTCDPDRLDCGGVCAECPDDPNGDNVCSGTTCTTDCDPGYHLCDGVCVSDDSTDHCGTGCAPCPVPPNATATCDGTSCGFDCQPGFIACGGACVQCPDDPNGHGAGACIDGACSFDCDPGYHACDTGGCEPDDSLIACGPDCETCTAPTGATPICGGEGGCDYDCISFGKMPCQNGTGCCDWLVTELQTTANGTQPHGLEVDGSGKIHALWRDAANGDVRYGVKTNTWAIETVVTGGATGLRTSLAVHPAGFPAFAYQNADGETWFALRGGAAWGFEKVGDETPIGLSLVFDGSLPRILYGRYALRHTSKSGGQWNEEIIDDFETDQHELKFCDMAVDDQGIVHIVYRADDENLPWNIDAPVIYATNASGEWMKETVAEVAGISGVSLAVAPGPIVHVAYDDGSGLGYARRDLAGWTTQHLRDDSQLHSNGALALTSAGAPWIAYANLISAGGYAHLSRLVGTTWIHETVQSEKSTGRSAVLDFDAFDRPHILHHRVEYTGSNALYVQRTRYTTIP